MNVIYLHDEFLLHLNNLKIVDLQNEMFRKIMWNNKVK